MDVAKGRGAKRAKVVLAGKLAVILHRIWGAFIGLHPQPSMPIRDGAGPFAVRTAAPALGEHNGEVLSGLLGLSCAEIAQLASEGIIGTSMLSEGS
ncbi:hypothetical protein FBZ96_105595 [Bradyrhizobium stylosanthis]|uniref:CoA transferase family III n=1 Tax=Bradyrhizobium stylosanthis TaxID=1803665 RepID=A0A560DP77_9BRAD|nr:hypothetical protein FBZ96_105595 [Bradyrhizobium stylosanthis]